MCAFGSRQANYTLFAIAVASRGLYSLALVLIVNWRDLRRTRATMISSLVDDELTMQARRTLCVSPYVSCAWCAVFPRPPSVCDVLLSQRAAGAVINM